MKHSLAKLEQLSQRTWTRGVKRHDIRTSDTYPFPKRSLNIIIGVKASFLDNYLKWNDLGIVLPLRQAIAAFITHAIKFTVEYLLPCTKVEFAIRNCDNNFTTLPQPFYYSSSGVRFISVSNFRISAWLFGGIYLNSSTNALG